MKRPAHSLPLLAAALMLACLTGCASYQIQVKSYDGLGTYRKVYVSAIRNDKMSMQGRISERLKEAGFDTVDLELDGPPVGSQGSGFLLDREGHVLTCAHVVRGSQDATLWIHGKRYLGAVLAMDTNADLALIKIDGGHNTFDPLPFVQNKNYHLGEEIYAMGFPMADELGNSVHLTKGLVSSTAGLKGDTKELQVSAQIQPGNSGGPLLNEKGEAIGVMASTYNPLRMLAQSGNDLPQDVNFAIKNSTIEEFLKKAKFNFPTETSSKESSLDTAQKSIVLVRAGIVEDGDLNVPTLFCGCRYLMQDGYDMRLKGLALRFMDTKTLKTVLIVTGMDENFTGNHGEMLDEMFSQMYTKCFPARPNPFKKYGH